MELKKIGKKLFDVIIGMVAFFRQTDILAERAVIIINAAGKSPEEVAEILKTYGVECELSDYSDLSTSFKKLMVLHLPENAKHFEIKILNEEMEFILEKNEDLHYYLPYYGREIWIGITRID